MVTPLGRNESEETSIDRYYCEGGEMSDQEIGFASAELESLEPVVEPQVERLAKVPMRAQAATILEDP